ncbi:ribonuclease M5 [Guggenheimella bovis]
MQTIKETIVVEGRDDKINILRCVPCEVIEVHGFGMANHVMKQVKFAYETKGIIIFTDPDQSGERIRKKLSERFPKAKHAFISREEGTKGDDIGVENASCESILNALSRVRTLHEETNEFSQSDLIHYDLSGSEQASARRDKLGSLLGIGYGNSKQFLKRLNHYGVTRQEFLEKLSELSTNES